MSTKQASGKSIQLNLGCGDIRPENWINVDSSLNAQLQKIPFFGKLLSEILNFKLYDSDNVIYQNLNKKWPYADNSVDIIYSSHLFEHLYKNARDRFLKESYRCLKNTGRFRIVVPDLYQICKKYISEYENTNTQNTTEYIMWALNLHREGQYGNKINFFKRIFYDFLKYPHQHKYMYDSKSLKNLLKNAGFVNITESKYGKSSLIENIRDVEGKSESYLSVYLECQKII